MFSQTAEYALRAVVWLADRDESSPLGVQLVAEGTQVPPSYLSKILQELSRAGLVSSRRGAGGGYFLARSPAEITVLDVIQVVDPLQRITGCPLGIKSHQKKLCAMHARLDQAVALVEEALAASSIQDLISTPQRPQPMKESRSSSLLPVV